MVICAVASGFHARADEADKRAAVLSALKSLPALQGVDIQNLETDGKGGYTATLGKAHMPAVVLSGGGYTWAAAIIGSKVPFLEVLSEEKATILDDLELGEMVFVIAGSERRIPFARLPARLSKALKRIVKDDRSGSLHVKRGVTFLAQVKILKAGAAGRGVSGKRPKLLNYLLDPFGVPDKVYELEGSVGRKALADLVDYFRQSGARTAAHQAESRKGLALSMKLPGIIFRGYGDSRSGPLALAFAGDAKGVTATGTADAKILVKGHRIKFPALLTFNPDAKGADYAVGVSGTLAGKLPELVKEKGFVGKSISISGGLKGRGGSKKIELSIKVDGVKGGKPVSREIK